MPTMSHTETIAHEGHGRNHRSADSRRGHRLSHSGLMLAVFLLAVTVRLIYCVWLIPADKGVGVSGADEWQYDHFAQSILAGKGMSHPNGAPSAQRTPGYPLLLSAVYGTFGHSLMAARLLQCLLGGTTCVLLWLLIRRWISPSAGFLAASILAVYPTHIWLSAEILSENVSAPAMLLTLLTIDWARRGGRLGRWAVAGTVTGCSAMVHPIIAALGVVLSATMIISSRWDSRYSWRHVTAMGVVLAVFVGGWMTRNHAVLGTFTLSTGTGAVLLGSNNDVTATDPKYRGYWISEWDVPGVTQYAHPRQNEVVRSANFQRCAVAWLLDNPHHWPRLAAFKLIRFYSPFLNDWRSSTGRLYLASYGLLLPFIAIGVWGLLRQGWATDRSGVRLMLIVVGYFTGIVIVYWGAPRFRLTIEPLLIAFASVAMIRLASSLAAAWRTPPRQSTPFVRKPPARVVTATERA